MIGFAQSLLARASAGFTPIIPDFKHISPKDGDLFGQRDVGQVAKDLESLGAPAISVVTEPKYFGGSTALLQKVRESCSLPILRKDFIRTIQDVSETKDMGATAILLISGLVDSGTLKRLYNSAIELGLEPLIETSEPSHLRFAHTLGARLLGINNKNIFQQEKDDGTVATTEKLSALVSPDAILISESSLHTPKDVQRALAAGAHTCLIGTALWQATDMKTLYTEFSAAKKSEY
jgi:indole-3-glycerol phosphate synthase